MDERKWLRLFFLTPVLCLPALAQNQIVVWSATGTYDVSQTPRTVILTSAGTFKMKATDPGGPQGFGVIESITVAEGVTGTVELYVVDEYGGPGADRVGWINLMNATEGNVARLYAYRYLGPDPENPDPGVEPTYVNAVTGLFHSGWFCKDVHVQSLSATGQIDTGTLYGDVFIEGAGPHQGAIRILYPEAHNLAVAGTMEGVIDLGNEH